MIIINSCSHSALIFCLIKSQSLNLCALFPWNLDSRLEIVSQRKQLILFLIEELHGILSLHFKHFLGFIMFQGMTKEQSMRCSVAIHTSLQQYMLEWLNQARTLNVLCGQVYREGIDNRTRAQLQKVSLDVLMERQRFYPPWFCFLELKTSETFPAWVCANI